jgi:hypothetical protein
VRGGGRGKPINIHYYKKWIFIMTEPTESQLLDDLFTSITNAMKYYSAIRDEIVANTYTPQKAYEDYENLTCNEGNNIMSVLSELADRK